MTAIPQITPAARAVAPAKPKFGRASPPALGPTSASAAAPRKRATAPSLFHQPALVVLGRDDRGRPHASWFDETEVKAATSAALLMGMRALAVSGDELAALASRLPHGRLFASGKAFVPFVKEDTFNALSAHLSADDEAQAVVAGAAETTPRKAAGRKAASAATVAAQSSAGGDGAGDGSNGNGNGGDEGSEAGGGNGADGSGGEGHRPTTWAKVTLGSLVLATEGPQEGWFEAIVDQALENDNFIVRWRDWPDERPFARNRNQLALMPTGQLSSGRDA